VVGGWFAVAVVVVVVVVVAGGVSSLEGGVSLFIMYVCMRVCCLFVVLLALPHPNQVHTPHVSPRPKPCPKLSLGNSSSITSLKQYVLSEHT
jgi:hypothetical protein